MRVFLDSSKISEVEKWNPIIEGVTTNPSILLKDGGCDLVKLAQLLEDRPVSIEATKDFVTEARYYAKLCTNVVVKVPLLTPTGGNNLKVIKELTAEGIKINCTALFSLSQVILATKAGARYVSLFAGRVDDEGGYATSMIRDCADFLDYEPEEVETELIVGSIRTVGNVLDAVRAGAHIVTITPAILEKMIKHKNSLATVIEFEEDAKKLK